METTLDSRLNEMQSELQIMVDKLPNDYRTIGQEALRLAMEGNMDFSEYCEHMEEKFPELRKDAKKTSVAYKKDLVLAVMLAGDIISIKNDVCLV